MEEPLAAKIIEVRHRLTGHSKHLAAALIRLGPIELSLCQLVISYMKVLVSKME